MADDPSIPTQFGWDASHYDGILTVYNLADARAEGIAFFTHKVGEGRSYDDPLDATNLAAAREAGIEFIGGYYVVRSTDVTAQVDNCIRLADRDEPWWRTFPGWFWQVDLERWPYDSVDASVGIAFAKQLRARTGRMVILYASRGQYGDQLTAWDGPLWNAAYGSNPYGPFKDVYPGDSSSRWAPYSGKTPAILQYSSHAIIAGLDTCDANAFRGTYEQLRALITGDDMDQNERLVQETGWEYRTVGHTLADEQNLRNFLVGEAPSPRPGEEGPMPGSPAWNVAHLPELLKQHAAAPVDPAALAALVEPMLAAMEARLEAKFRDAVADLGEGGAAAVRADQA